MIYSDTLTFEFLLEEMLSYVPDTVDKREGSVIYDALAPVAQELAAVYRDLDVVMDETFVDTASLQFLMERAKERGVPIKEATSAILEGTFTPSTLEIPQGTRFNCEDQNYISGEKISNGKYRLEAETPGTGGNLYSGQLLPMDYVEGLETATITNVLIPGEDDDTAETLRERYYESLESVAFGGNQADYKEKVSLLAGVGGVKVTPIWNGGGTVKVTIINSDYGIPSQTLIDTVQEAVDPTQNQGQGLGLAPIGHVVTVVGVTGQTINLAMDMAFADGWTWTTAKTAVEDAVKEYFATLAEAWESEAVTVVRIAYIETAILALDCVIDIANTTINGTAANLQLDFGKIPVLGEMTVVT